MISPTFDELLAGIVAFHKHEPRDAMYKTATFLVKYFWGQSSEMADGLGVLLLTWNQAFYRYGVFDFAFLEECIADSLEELKGFRARDISAYDYSDNTRIMRLFHKFNDALRIRKEGEEGHKSAVSTAKALHLLAPAFFPLWDQEIAKAHGCSYQSKPADNYLRFMREMKRIIKSVDFSPLTAQFGKTALKLIDEYNYARFTKNWI